MKGLSEVFADIKIGEVKRKGIAEISKYYVSEEKARRDNIRGLMSYDPAFMRIEEGEFVVLKLDGYGVMMSDTPMEKRTNNEFVYRANGRVMIAGLGIGLILHNLRDKVKSGEVTEIVIYELYQDVIDLVSPYYADLPIIYKCEDIFEYKPDKTEVYDTIYFDIWETITTDNLPDMSLLHRRWTRRLNKANPNNYIDSWMKYYLHKQKRAYG